MFMDHSKIYSEQIKAEALRLGFSACGIVPARPVDEATASSFRRWLTEGKQAGMDYMANYEAKRLDPRLLMEGTQSIICVALNYYPAQHLPADQYQFAWYAYGQDYHDVMKRKLSELQAYIATLSPLPLQSRVFCDTAPVLERYWAWQSGLGWIGKNTQLIIPHAGSSFFLGEIFIDAETDVYDSPQADRCGNCTRCLDACPTNALEAPYLLNSRRCFSFLTIEYRGDFPRTTGFKMQNKIYGCDDCQKACPWNRFATPCSTPEFQSTEAFRKMKKEDWEALTEEQYRRLFQGSAVKRAKYEGLMRNIRAASEDEQVSNNDRLPH